MYLCSACISYMASLNAHCLEGIQQLEELLLALNAIWDLLLSAFKPADESKRVLFIVESLPSSILVGSQSGMCTLGSHLPKPHLQVYTHQQQKRWGVRLTSLFGISLLHYGNYYLNCLLEIISPLKGLLNQSILEAHRL